MQEQWYSPSVMVNIALVLVGLLYAGFACSQWVAIKRQAKFARRTLRAIRRQADIAASVLALTHRPRLKQRSFAVNNDVFEPGENGFTIDLGYDVVNYGGTDATITDSNCTILLRHVSEPCDLPPLPPYDVGIGNQIAEPETVLRGGEARRFFKRQAVTQQLDVQFGMGHVRVYAIGYLTYRDTVGPHYRTGFCRRLEVEESKPTGFVVVPNPNYEYQD